ncbi:MAG: DUF4438 domain-containing protein [Corallococcus sp.]|nr:DUF4438 domain-containing protein [Corallococcus sp.]
MRTNKYKLVIQSVSGKVHHPVVRLTDTRIDCNGNPFALPNVGGICYNVTLGDSVYGWEGDHIEPDVSLINDNPQENFALNFLSCIGNRATVVTGDAKGGKGYVLGKHGGIEHLLVWFDYTTKQSMCPNDVVLVKAVGQGLKLSDFPDIIVKNIDADLLEKTVYVNAQGKLTVPVVASVPAYLMGSGIGFVSSYTGDYDIMTADREAIVSNGLDGLRLGDVVALFDCDTAYGRGYRKDTLTIGVVVHSDCKTNGHGPGVVTVLNCKVGDVNLEFTPSANIGKYLGIVK